MQWTGAGSPASHSISAHLCCSRRFGGGTESTGIMTQAAPPNGCPDVAPRRILRASKSQISDALVAAAFELHMIPGMAARGTFFDHSHAGSSRSRKHLDSNLALLHKVTQHERCKLANHAPTVPATMKALLQADRHFLFKVSGDTTLRGRRVDVYRKDAEFLVQGWRRLLRNRTARTQKGGKEKPKQAKPEQEKTKQDPKRRKAEPKAIGAKTDPQQEESQVEHELKPATHERRIDDHIIEIISSEADTGSSSCDDGPDSDDEAICRQLEDGKTVDQANAATGAVAGPTLASSEAGATEPACNASAAAPTGDVTSDAEEDSNCSSSSGSDTDNEGGCSLEPLLEAGQEPLDNKGGESAPTVTPALQEPLAPKLRAALAAARSEAPVAPTQQKDEDKSDEENPDALELKEKLKQKSKAAVGKGKKTKGSVTNKPNAYRAFIKEKLSSVDFQPGVQSKERFKLAVQAWHDASGTASKTTGKVENVDLTRAEEPQKEDLEACHADLGLQVFGCSKCRKQQSGCKQCNPAKKAAYDARKSKLEAATC